MAERTAERSSSLVESHKGYDLRLLFFYPAVAALLLTLVGGLAYQQLIKTDEYHVKEKQQNQRRILTPGPRGNIYDREDRLLVKNRARFYAALNLDELRKEFRDETIRIGRNYRDADPKDMPSPSQIRLIARYSVVQGYLDKINKITGRSGKVDAENLNRHFASQLLLPYTLVDELSPEEYARLVEQLPVASPLQIYAASTREYPYKTLAAHTLGYVLAHDELDGSDFQGNDLHTLKMRGTIGKDGLEARFNDQLQGKPGGAIYRVDPSGYRQEPPLERRLPVQGASITTSLDIDLQLAAEEAVLAAQDQDSTEKLAGAVVAIDIATGEVLALASMPNYDLNNFTPRLSNTAAAEMTEAGAWSNRAIQGLYPPGSTFKIMTALAAFQSGAMKAHDTVTCKGSLLVGNRSFPCHGGAVHGEIELPHAIAVSCNVFFMTEGLATGPKVIADEAARFHFGQPTGIELLYEKRGIVPPPDWKERTQGQKWFPGDTANTSIGQGFVLVTPLQMACFAASIARGETYTPPTLIHKADRPRLRTESIGIAPQQYATIMEGMRECVESGTSRRLTQVLKLGGLKIAGKTGTAQKAVYEGGAFKGNINYAWFMGFAPYDDPQIAVVVMLEGNVPGEEYGGGAMSAPVAGAVFKKYFEKKYEKPALPAPTTKVTSAR